MNKSLTCNICNTSLGIHSVVAACGHLFCQTHGHHLKVADCPICGKTSDKLELNLTKEHLMKMKKIVLLGYSPTEAMEALNSALEFWEVQLQIQRLRALEAKEREFKEKMGAVDRLMAAYAEFRGQFEHK